MSRSNFQALKTIYYFYYYYYYWKKFISTGKIREVVFECERMDELNFVHVLSWYKLKNIVKFKIII